MKNSTLPSPRPRNSGISFAAILKPLPPRSASAMTKMTAPAVRRRDATCIASKPKELNLRTNMPIVPQSAPASRISSAERAELFFMFVLRV